MAGANLEQTINELAQGALASDLSALSRRVRKRPVVLFFGRPTFADNSKYLYLRALSRERAYEVYWCAVDDRLAATLEAAGLPCLNLRQHVDVAIDMLLHAAVAVFCVNPLESVGGLAPLVSCLDGAAKIQLWHGVSVKRLTLQLISFMGARNIQLRRPWEFTSRADHVLSPSSHLDGFCREAFGCRSLLRAGYPRNEVIVRKATALEYIGATLDDRAQAALADSGRKKLLLAPTWQRGQPTFLGSPDFGHRLAAHARANGYEVFVKSHPLVVTGTKAEGEHLHFVDTKADIYPWLSSFDALLTDYSSIMFDFLLGGRPVLRLDLPPGTHQQFEPDFSLVPEPPSGEYAHVFTPETLEQQLDRAWGDDRLGQARADMAGCLFESDPRQASDALMPYVDTLVARAVADDHVVTAL